MEWIETTAKTVEAAKEAALDQLHVDESDAEFEILEEPRPGLFGRLRGEARVRARVRPVQPRPKVDRRDRRRPSRRGRRGEKADGQAADTGSRAESAAAAGRDRSPAAASHADSTREDATPEAPSRSGGNSNRNRRRSGRGRTSGAATAPNTERSTNEESRVSQQSDTDTTGAGNNGDVTVHEQAEIVQTFVEGLVEAFGVDAQAESVEIDDETVEIRVDGDDLGLLVGPRGATLQAIHDLSRSVVQRQATGTHHGRVRLDIAGYRERRRDALERFTQRLAQTAIETGVAQALEPMSAADRKVVHDTANAIDGVHTVSEGEDFRRHVVIVPDNDQSDNRQSDND